MGCLITSARRVTPVIGKRDTAFPWVVELTFGDGTLRRLVVLVGTSDGAVNNNNAGLMIARHSGNGRHIDVLSIATRPNPSSVEPKDIYTAIARKDFFHLPMCEALELLPSPGVLVDGVVHVAPLLCIDVPPIVL